MPKLEILVGPRLCHYEGVQISGKETVRIAGSTIDRRINTLTAPPTY
jgi:hypothetical protein